MSKVNLTGQYIEIRARADEAAFLHLLDNVDDIYPVPRRKDTYRCSRRKLPEVLLYLKGIAEPKGLPAAFEKAYNDEILRRTMTAELKQNGTTAQYPGLWKHQNLGVELARYNSRYNFYYDTRTGKTRMSYQIILNALKEGRAKRALVLAPAMIIQDWLHDAEEFPELKVVAYYMNDLQKYNALHSPSHVVLWSLGTFVDELELIQRIGFDMVVFDESSKLKSYRTKTAQAALELSTQVNMWYNLSATPAPNGEQEYWIQMLCLDRYAFNPVRTHFVNRFFDNYSNNKNYEKLHLRPTMQKAFMDVIEDYSIYVDQSVMPMAQKIWHTITFHLGPDTWELYKTMATDSFVEIVGKEPQEEIDCEGYVIAASQAVAVRSKLNQIASNFIMDTEAIKENRYNRMLKQDATMQEVYSVGSGERLAALRKLIDGLLQAEPRASIIIWAYYAAEFRDIERMLEGDTFRTVRGGTTSRDKESAIADFRAGRCRFLLAHPLSIGMGINLTRAHHAIYYSINDSWESFKQSSERICGHIKVQPHDCHYWVIQAEGTVNELIYQNVASKRDASTGLLEHLKAVSLA